MTSTDIIGQGANGNQQQENVLSKPTRADHPKRRNNEDFDLEYQGQTIKENFFNMVYKTSEGKTMVWVWTPAGL